MNPSALHLLSLATGATHSTPFSCVSPASKSELSEVTYFRFISEGRGAVG